MDTIPPTLGSGLREPEELGILEVLGIKLLVRRPELLEEIAVLELWLTSTEENTPPWGSKDGATFFDANCAAALYAANVSDV